MIAGRSRVVNTNVDLEIEESLTDLYSDGRALIDKVQVHCVHLEQSPLEGLVVNQLNVNVLAGNPFLVIYGIATHPSKNQINIRGSKIHHYG